eukprot:3437748-Rhodomonas_salina.1
MQYPPIFRYARPTPCPLLPYAVCVVLIMWARQTASGGERCLTSSRTILGLSHVASSRTPTPRCPTSLRSGTKRAVLTRGAAVQGARYWGILCGTVLRGRVVVPGADAAGDVLPCYGRARGSDRHGR